MSSQILNISSLEIFFQLFFSLALGFLIGLERWHLGKAAGARTFSLVSLGATLFTIVSRSGFRGDFDPSRMAAQVVVGIGFIGMGVIIHHGLEVRGLTTASSLWVAAAIGVCVGVQLYYVALASALIAFIVLSVVRILDVEAKLEDVLFSETREDHSQKQNWLTRFFKGK